MSKWRYVDDGRSYGPVDDAVIREMAVRGRLGPDSYILVEGSQSWSRLYVHEATLGLRRSSSGAYVAADVRR